MKSAAVSCSLLCLALALPMQPLCLAAPEDQERDYIDAGRGEKFDVTKRSIPKSALKGGGPPKDGIPALTNPGFVKAAYLEKFLKPKDRVIGLVEKGVAKAYPIKIMTRHEVVNDVIGGKAVTVSY